MSKLIGFLSDGEMLELCLRRDEVGKGQLAQALGISPNDVTDMVKDRKPLEVVKREKLERIIQGYNDGKLEEWEWCWLFRRRKGWSIREMGRRYGVSHVTVIKWERGQGQWWRGVEWWDGCGIPEEERA